jgi:hypothetical protein
MAFAFAATATATGNWGAEAGGGAGLSCQFLLAWILMAMFLLVDQQTPQYGDTMKPFATPLTPAEVAGVLTLRHASAQFWTLSAT